MQQYNFENISLSKWPEWELQSEDGVISIYDPVNGVGALQVSVYNIPYEGESDLKSELAEFVTDYIEEEIREKIISTSQLNDGYAFVELENTENYWLFILFRDLNTVAFITYNCELEDKKIEMSRIWEVIKSIKLNQTYPT